MTLLCVFQPSGALFTENKLFALEQYKVFEKLRLVNVASISLKKNFFTCIVFKFYTED